MQVSFRSSPWSRLVLQVNNSRAGMSKRSPLLAASYLENERRDCISFIMLPASPRPTENGCKQWKMFVISCLVEATLTSFQQSVALRNPS